MAYPEQQKIIGLVGRAGSGKSFAAQWFCQYRNAELQKLAGPLKDMCRAIGMTEDMIEGELKEQPVNILCGKTPRYVMQTLGTEWGRDTIDEDFWTTLWANRVHSTKRDVVCDDVRFPNEARIVQQLGGFLIRIRPAGGGYHEISDAHPSEQYIDQLPVDMELSNPFDESFKTMLDMAWEQVRIAIKRRNKGKKK